MSSMAEVEADIKAAIRRSQASIRKLALAGERLDKAKEIYREANGKEPCHALIGRAIAGVRDSGKQTQEAQNLLQEAISDMRSYLLICAIQAPGAERTELLENSRDFAEGVADRVGSKVPVEVIEYCSRPHDAVITADQQVEYADVIQETTFALTAIVSVVITKFAQWKRGQK